MPVEIQPGDVLEMKKEHPCGSRQWEVLRVGMDFRLHRLRPGSHAPPAKGRESGEKNHTFGTPCRLRQEACFYAI